MVLKYLIHGKLWFDKVGGNTYHSFTITDLVNNIELHHSPICYGYGDSYKFNAIRWLIAKGLWFEKDEFNHEKIREKIMMIKEENCLKREL